MSLECTICHKGSMRGNFVSHSKQRTHRLFKPNLHAYSAVVNGMKKSLRLCTKCLRRIKNLNNKTSNLKTVQETKVPIPEMPKASVEAKSSEKPKEVKVKTMTIEELMKESKSEKEMDEKVRKKPAKRKTSVKE